MRKSPARSPLTSLCRFCGLGGDVTTSRPGSVGSSAVAICRATARAAPILVATTIWASAWFPMPGGGLPKSARAVFSGISMALELVTTRCAEP